ncbi:MAG: hypothetical protein KAS32_24615 [Candidatus Peribacteraceae bacterium]|nr:hypothetical protein [Candidatus Peribacteraceae bacterium]
MKKEFYKILLLAGYMSVGALTQHGYIELLIALVLCLVLPHFWSYVDYLDYLDNDCVD